MIVDDMQVALQQLLHDMTIAICKGPSSMLARLAVSVTIWVMTTYQMSNVYLASTAVSVTV